MALFESRCLGMGVYKLGEMTAFVGRLFLTGILYGIYYVQSWSSTSSFQCTIARACISSACLRYQHLFFDISILSTTLSFDCTF